MLLIYDDYLPGLILLVYIMLCCFLPRLCLFLLSCLLSSVYALIA